MTDLLAPLGGAVWLRPFVFAFLAVHAWTAFRGLGARRAEALRSRAAWAWQRETSHP